MLIECHYINSHWLKIVFNEPWVGARIASRQFPLAE